MNDYPRVFKSRYGKVTVYRYVPKKGRPRYKIYWMRGKARFEEKYSDEQKALIRAEELLATLENGEECVAKTSKEKLSYYIACEELLQGRTTLMDLVRNFLREDLRLNTTVLKVAVESYLDAMGTRGLSPAHLVPVRSRLLRFVESMPEHMGEITLPLVTEYLERFENLTTRQNERMVLNRFFNWCQMQGLLPAGTPHVIARTDMPKPKWEEPKIITPKNMGKALWAASVVYPELVPAIALGGFGGLRRAEIVRLREEDIDMEKRFITLSAKITKLNRRRVLPMNDTLHAWLTAYPVRGGMLDDGSYAFKFRRCTQNLKLNWPDNGLRHSYVSYRVQLEKDISAVALECGHSVETLQHNYRRLCSEEQAKEWFSITPESNGLQYAVAEGVQRI